MGQSRWHVLRFEEVGVLGALAVLGLVFSLTTDTFLHPNNLLSVARQASYFGIMAVGMVFVLTLGEVDLSVGSVLTLVNVLTAVALREGVPLPLALAAGLAAGAGCGFINGLLSVMLRIPTIIVTLGTMSVYRGLALVVSEGLPISEFSKNNTFFRVGGDKIAGVPTSVAVMLAAMIAGQVLLQRTVFGRRVQAIGGNPRAALLSGISTVRYKLVVMTQMGAVSAVAGIAALAFLQAADPSTGLGFELFVIAAAIIGGTALSGGSGSAVGAVLGALVIAVIRNGLVLLGVTAFWSTVVTGALIIAAVAVDYFIKKRS